MAYRRTFLSWCGPCHQLAPVIEKLTNEPNKSGSNLPFDLVKIDTDSEAGQVLGAQYKVRRIYTDRNTISVAGIHPKSLGPCITYCNCVS